jgi:hypothetical protein
MDNVLWTTAALSPPEVFFLQQVAAIQQPPLSTWKAA